MQDAKWSIYENLASCPKNVCKLPLNCYIFHLRYSRLHKNGSLCPNLSECCLLFWLFAAKLSFPSTYKPLETGIKQLKNIQSKEKRRNKKTKPVEISLNERGGGWAESRLKWPRSGTGHRAGSAGTDGGCHCSARAGVPARTCQTLAVAVISAEEPCCFLFSQNIPQHKLKSPPRLLRASCGGEMGTLARPDVLAAFF